MMVLLAGTLSCASARAHWLSLGDPDYEAYFFGRLAGVEPKRVGSCVVKDDGVLRCSICRTAGPPPANAGVHTLRCSGSPATEPDDDRQGEARHDGASR